MWTDIDTVATSRFSVRLGVYCGLDQARVPRRGPGNAKFPAPLVLPTQVSKKTPSPLGSSSSARKVFKNHEPEIYNYVPIRMHIELFLLRLLGKLYSTQARMSRMVYAEHITRLHTGVPGEDAHPETNNSIAHKSKHFWPTFAQQINLKLFMPLHQV